MITRTLLVMSDINISNLPNDNGPDYSYDASLYNSASYVDPLEIDKGFPLDSQGQFLAVDYIPDEVVPYAPDLVDGTTLAKPVTIGVAKRGISNCEQYSGLPNFGGRLSLSTGVVTEYFTGNQYSWYDWQQYQYFAYRERMIELNEARDLASDIQNLPGIKPTFEDTWHSPPLFPPYNQRNPRVQF